LLSVQSNVLSCPYVPSSCSLLSRPGFSNMILLLRSPLCLVLFTVPGRLFLWTLNSLVPFFSCLLSSCAPTADCTLDNLLWTTILYCRIPSVKYPIESEKEKKNKRYVNKSIMVDLLNSIYNVDLGVLINDESMILVERFYS